MTLGVVLVGSGLAGSGLMAGPAAAQSAGASTCNLRDNLTRNRRTVRVYQKKDKAGTYGGIYTKGSYVLYDNGGVGAFTNITSSGSVARGCVPFPDNHLVLQVDTTPLTTSTLAGVFCRGDQGANGDFYVFTIAANGQWFVKKIFNNTGTTLASGSVNVTPGQPVTLQAECVGMGTVTLPFSINGTQVAAPTDPQSTLDTGDLGLIMAGTGQGRAAASYNHLTVSEASP